MGHIIQISITFKIPFLILTRIQRPKTVSDDKFDYMKQKCKYEIMDLGSLQTYIKKLCIKILSQWLDLRK